MLHFDRIQHRLFFIMSIIIVVLAGALIFREYHHYSSNASVIALQENWEQPANEFLTQNSPGDVKSAEVKSIKIYLTGQIANPGIITMTEGERVADAIDLAGGTLPDADLDRINLAVKVKDEGMYYIPKLGEELPDAAALQASMGYSSSNGKININSATKEQLETLNGIGPAKAQNIIDYRDKNGGFSSIEDIMNVSGIGMKTYEGFMDQIDIH